MIGIPTVLRYSNYFADVHRYSGAIFTSPACTGLRCVNASFFSLLFAPDFTASPPVAFKRTHVAAGVQFNMVAVIADESLDHADAVYDFARGYIDSLTDFHFNLLDTHTSQIVDEDAAAPDVIVRERLVLYRRFLRRLLERSRQDVLEKRQPLPIRNFRHIYTRVLGSDTERHELSMRSMARPMKTLSVEADGQTTAFYAELTSNDYVSLFEDDCGLVVGNLLSDSVPTIAASAKLRRIAADFETSHRACEEGCDYAPLCGGGFNLTKKVRFGTFDVTETPECVAHVKTVVDEVLGDLQRHADTNT